MTSSAAMGVGVIGCGSVSRAYLPHLANCPHVELISPADTKSRPVSSRAFARLMTRFLSWVATTPLFCL